MIHEHYRGPDAHGAPPLQLTPVGPSALQSLLQPSFVGAESVAGSDASFHRGIDTAALEWSLSEDRRARAAMQLPEPGKLALLKAVERDDVNTIKTLISQGIDYINPAVQHGKTPLFVGAMLGRKAVTDYLASCGADVDRFWKFNYTPLSVAAEYGHLDVCGLLLRHGAKVDLVNDMGWTALYIACMCGRLAVARLLIEHGAKVDIQTDYEGYTPLTYAAQNGHGEVIELLLQHGASPYITDANGNGIMWRAVQSGRLASVQALAAHVPALLQMPVKAGRSALHEACRQRANDIVEWLLTTGAECDMREESIRRGVREAAEAGCPTAAAKFEEYRRLNPRVASPQPLVHDAPVVGTTPTAEPQ